MPLNIDPSKPTQEEIVKHNMKVAKANLACDIIKFMVGNTGFFHEGKPALDPIALVGYAAAASEGAIESFSFMPDQDGKRGGLLS